MSLIRTAMVGARSFGCLALFAGLLLLQALPAFATPPVVSNVRASQRPGTKLVDIYYDVSDPDGDLQHVEVMMSSDGGLTWTIPCVTLSGDVGPNVSPGNDRHVVWNAGADWNGNFVPSTKARVTAFDGTTPPAPPGMVYIPAGVFQMGDNFEEGHSQELPVHNVLVSAFFIDRYEVYRELWLQVHAWALSNGYSINAGESKDVSHPVQEVTWFDCVKWCNARSEMEGLTPCYYLDETHTQVFRSGTDSLTNTMVDWTANGFRLPSSAEWEKAARGGTTGGRFPWGLTISHVNANYRAHVGLYLYETSTVEGLHPTFHVGQEPFTAPVGSIPPNAYGCSEMAGNVGEWCWDYFASDYYGSSPSLNNPRGSETGNRRIYRGGAYYDNADKLRCSHLAYDSPGSAFSDRGFRCVRGE